MNKKLKAVIIGIFCLGALVCGSFALAGAGQTKEAVTCLAADDWRYVIRDYEGYVAVFVENEPDCPMTVTDIPVFTLREMDRVLLQTGLKVQSHEKLMMTLEDIGS